MIACTTFAYSNPRVSAASFRDQDGVTVSVDVTNTGAVAGREIVQVYIHDQKATLVRPPKELKGFAKVALQPGETKTATISLDFRSFACYNPAYAQWVTESGAFDILIGASSADIRHRLTVDLTSTLALPSLLNRESTIREWLEDPRGKLVFAELYTQMMAQMGATFGGGNGAEGQEAIGMDMMGFMLEMPLRSILHFQEASLPMPADTLVDALLGQVQALPA